MANHYKVSPKVLSMIDRLNLSQKELSKRSGISGGYLSLLLNGQRCIGPSARARLQEALGKDFDELFEEITSD